MPALRVVGDGAEKAEIIAQAVERPITSMIWRPRCSGTRPHGGGGRCPASDLKGEDYYRWVFVNEPEWQEFGNWRRARGHRPGVARFGRVADGRRDAEAQRMMRTLKVDALEVKLGDSLERWRRRRRRMRASFFARLGHDRPGRP